MVSDFFKNFDYINKFCGDVISCIWFCWKIIWRRIVLKVVMRKGDRD